MSRHEFSFFSRWLVIYFVLFFVTLSGFISVPESASTQEGRVSRQENNTPDRYQVTEQEVLAQEIPASTSVSGETSGEWGIAKQIGEYTWTMQVGEDSQMATPQEIFQALNHYRQQKGRGGLSWNDNLANYAQSRANYFIAIDDLDSHAGFQKYLEEENGFEKLGFASVGENSSFGYQLSGVHLIEWIYAGDALHDNNQLDSKWQYVGIGVDGTATDVIFGAEKL